MSLLVSCHDMGPGPSSSTISNILPLNVGNKWVAFVTPYDSLGKAGLGSSTTIELVRDTVIESQRWFYYLGFGRKVAYRCTESGAAVRLVSPNIGENEGIRYKQPCTRGETYRLAMISLSPDGDRITLDSTYICTVKSIDTVITVPAGTFHCIHYYVREYDGADSWDDFLAPGSGWIKYVQYIAPVPGRPAYVSSISEATSIELH
jgi:hypothetical protein